MKTKLLFTLLVCSLGIVNAQAQCAARIGWQENPGSGLVTFWADSVIGGTGSTSYTWDFGDNSTGTGDQLTHQYTLNGMLVTYTVCMTMTDATTSCNFTICDSIRIPFGGSGNCSAYITQAQQDSLYTFTTTNTGTGPYTYSWLVNGNSTDTTGVIALVIDTLNSSNYVEVCVTVTDSSGCVSTDCVYVYDNSNNGGCNSYTTFTVRDSIYTFFASTTGTAPFISDWYLNGSYSASGSTYVLVIDTSISATYEVCATITDANGCISNSCVSITSGNPLFGTPCQAYFVIYPDSGNGTPGYYYGYNNSSGNYNQNVFWDFGDGQTSTDPYPTHSYSAPGNYIVCLTVGTPGTNCYDTYCDSSFYVFKTAGGQMSHLAILGPTAITETPGNTIAVYPNPVSNELNIVGNVEQVRIFNLNGQKVFEAKTPGSKLNLAKLNTGVYLLELTAGEDVLRTKLVKE